MASASALRTIARMGATTACRGVLARVAPRAIPARRAASGVRHASVLTVDNPYTGGVAAEVELVDETRAFAQLTNAAVIQRSWRHVPLEDRIALCERFLEALKARQGDIAKEITAMMGKPLSQASGEVDGAIERAQGVIDLAPAALAEEVLPEKPGFFRKIVKEPVGVVLTIAPWNYPLLTTVNSVIPAILAGNSVIIKHSARTPLCADHFVDAFAAAGAPEGLITSLHCDHDVVNAVIRNPLTAFVSFTGSVPGGHAVYESVASRFIDATLELGGKDPGYVREDANLQYAIEGLADGGFYNAGQSCCGIERVYVHQSLYADFVEGLVEQVKAHKLGDPMDAATTIGPMAQDNAPAFLAAQVEDATSKGARLLLGGAPCKDAAGNGRFFAPTVLADCKHDMSVMVDESFGPILGVMPVSGDDEAVALMNDSPYGLTACVMTQDQDKAIEIAQKLETGTVFQNRCDYLDPMLPWTGVKDTGKGISLSSHGFRGVTRVKGYHLKSI